MLRRTARRSVLLVTAVALLYALIFVFISQPVRQQRNIHHSDARNQVLRPQMQLSQENIEKRANNYRDMMPSARMLTRSVLPNERNFIPSNRIFHLDFKGAAPKIDYILQLIPFIKRIGATGVLIEYEDMFPFKGNLTNISAHNAYSEVEIHQILRSLVVNGLEIIPLIQTVGHLEYVLKYRIYSEFRQEERYPQVICLANERAVELVHDLISQVLNVHEGYNIKFVHIGADEVFQVGHCSEDRDFINKNHVDSEYLLIRHIAQVAKYVKSKFNGDVKVLIWHDMINNARSQNVEHFELGTLVEPVVWNYAENLEETFYPEFWQRLSSTFPSVWVASAFKGADGPDQFASNVPHYLANHISWLKQMNDYHQEFKQFRGVIVTGWQRFDHFAILCEVLPVGLLSAAVNFGVLKSGKYDAAVLRSVSRLLNCSSELLINKNSMNFLPRCEFPGVNIFNAIQSLKSTVLSIDEQVFNDYQIRGWMSEFNERHSYSQVWYLDQAVYKVKSFIRELKWIEEGLSNDMKSVFFNDTIDEFSFVYVKPIIKRLQELSDRIDKLSELHEYPKRPFQIEKH